MISENCCNFIVFKYKEIQTIIAMITEDKITELFCMADGFCKFSDAMMEKYTLKSNKKAALPPWFHHVKSWNHANHDTVSWFRLPLPEAFLSGKGMQTSASPLPESCLIQPFRGTWKGSCHTFGSVHQEGIAWEMYRHKFRGQHTLRGGWSLAVFLCQSDAGLSLGETACWRFLPYWRSVRTVSYTHLTLPTIA